MKRIAIIVLIIALLSACRKSESQSAVEGEVFEKGAPIGMAATKTVGVPGDQLQSTDGRLKLTIPAGALAENTVISIQAIGNTNPAGTGLSYRIAPGTRFEKPVTLSLSFREQEDSLGLAACLLAMAFQDSTGKWQMKTSGSIDETAGTISIETLQAGDWCAMMPIRLTPVESTVKPGDEVELKVLGYIPISSPDVCGNWQSPQFPHAEVAVNGGAPVPASMIEKWQLLATGRGVGTLRTDGSRAFYKTSSIDNPVMNPASIAVHLKGLSRPMLARVYVIPGEEYMILNINSVAYSYTYKDIAVHFDANTKHHGITWKNMLGGDEVGYITWQGRSEGSHTWDETENQFWFEPRDREEGAFFNSFVGDLNQRPSSGEVTITKFGAPGDFVTGSFILVDAGLRVPDDIYKGPHKITGKFKIRRED